ncbi:MAG: undecaprenyl-phosphate glucose phosphotransferase [Ignavibacteria bacterium]|jgi:putative colanic acid biosynthesis UDP-glucose lipid carrier transferase|nr:undecaprenyl-phosphate glucose phosphotransferase [Ignavibacteria bacterium]MCU7503735.1 undecaprenyl-phosphate glucose phosphotransferase [Ignavibacteria bacterium]MCU7517619.1 undecaprenyl-phosphate glucose phosphotransferase [Ignavibacteria bacterium]
MQLQRRALQGFRVYVDLGIIIASFMSAFYLRRGHLHLEPGHSFLLFSLLAIFLFSSRASDLYDEFRSRNFSFELISLIKNVLIQALTSVFVLFFIKEVTLSRQFVLYYSSVLLLTMGLEKYLFRKSLDFLRSKGRNTRSILIVGAGKVGEEFYNSIKNNPHFGYKLIGFLDDEEKSIPNGKYLGAIDELERVLTETHVDDVIIALPNQAVDTIDWVVKICDMFPTRIKIIPDYFRFVSQKYDVSMFGRFPVVSVREDPLNQVQWRIVKRAFDLFVTVSVFVLIFSWLWPIIFVLQKIFNPGPIFYKAPRWGRNGEEFMCYKFRSMVPESKNVNTDGKHRHTTKTDKRINGFGRLLRKTNFDELPQLINVLKGEMSIVGPRPHDVKENMEIKNKIKSYMWRHISKPGLTGWAQVNGYRGGTDDINLMRKRTEYDIWYIEHWSIWLDLQIVFLTAWRMIKGDPNAY